MPAAAFEAHENPIRDAGPLRVLGFTIDANLRCDEQAGRQARPDHAVVQLDVGPSEITHPIVWRCLELA